MTCTSTLLGPSSRASWTRLWLPACSPTSGMCTSFACALVRSGCFRLFAPTIRNQGTREQAKQWDDAIEHGSGAFAMTEIGHGSYIQGMETTATFDEATDQFVMHSPTLTATK